MAVISRVACFALSHEAFKSEGALHPSTFLRQGSPITLPDFSLGITSVSKKDLY